jgi:hypothetical protein
MELWAMIPATLRSGSTPTVVKSIPISVLASIIAFIVLISGGVAHRQTNTVRDYDSCCDADSKAYLFVCAPHL